MTQIIVPFLTPEVDGLESVEQDTLRGLVKVWAAKRPRNVVRQIYLDAKNRLDDLEVSIPQRLKERLGVVMGWPEQAVYGLASRIVWNGVVSTESDDPFELNSMLQGNRFDIELPQAVASSLTHSVAFTSTTKSPDGDVSILHHSAEWSSAFWDRRRREISAAMTITDSDDGGNPLEIVMFLPETVVTCTKRHKGWVVSDRRAHGLPRVPVEPLPFRPALDRPFGRSRISRQVMSITDRAMRAATRMDVSAEFYMAPHLFLMGADKQAFLDDEGNPVPLWSWLMGRVRAIEKDEDGEQPTLQQVRQQTMQPYTDQLRQLAAEFSGATSIPMSQLGIVHDNPSSAQAIYAASEPLVIEASNANAVFGYSLKRVYQNAVMLRDGLSEVTPELESLGTRWMNPARPSVVSQSDAMVKQISAIPWLAETTVALEELGYTDEQITRLLAEKRRAQGPGMLQQLLAARSAPNVQVEASRAPVEEP